MNKTLAAIGIASGLALGGLGTARVASAQAEEAPSEDPQVEARPGDTDDGTDRAEHRDGKHRDGADRAEHRDGKHRDGRRGHHHGRKGRAMHFESVSELLGMDRAEIRAELRAGNSLADIAEANDVDPAELVDAIVARMSERLDANVAEGHLTEAEAADKLAYRTERIEEKISRVPGEREKTRGAADADA